MKITERFTALGRFRNADGVKTAKDDEEAWHDWAPSREGSQYDPQSN
jgi:hypothetical protein